jgi:hypothetical protein
MLHQQKLRQLSSQRGEPMRSSTEEHDPWRLVERRKEARYTLILRAGVLEQEGRTSFCLVKNISITGVQLKTYSKPALDVAASVRVADEQPIAGHVAWINGDNAGISLDDELDAATLLRVQQKLRPNKRRALPRVNVKGAAILRTGGRIMRATVRDISSLGARVRLETQLAAGNRTIVEFSDLPSISAYVRWSDGDEVGLAFETPIPMQIIAHWIEGRARLAP